MTDPVNPASPAYDPALTGSADDGIFAIPTTLEHSRLVFIPVPWEATTSYGNGASLGPQAILQASPQLDLYQRDLPNHYEKGFHLLPPVAEITDLNRQAKLLVKAVQAELESAGCLDARPDLVEAREAVNGASRLLNSLVHEQCRALDEQGKLFALIGGDHSSPLGLIHYLCDKYQGNFGVLHIDAHLDLRDAYQGFAFSHASIMRNVMALEPAPRKLVQVAIRDFSEEECAFAAGDPRIAVFYDEDIKGQLYSGVAFGAIVADIIAALPDNVYVSFDIDGLKPNLCPHTGTPVAGGLEFEQARFLIKSLVQSGRRIIGFDLCEVCPNPLDSGDEWDGNVGARVLFLLASWMMESQ